MSCVKDTVEDNPMQYLIIEKNIKSLLLAVAGSRSEKTALKPWATEWTADFIEGKGRGNVIFLLGEC
jgi:hypothetical protein